MPSWSFMGQKWVTKRVSDGTNLNPGKPGNIEIWFEDYRGCIKRRQTTPDVMYTGCIRNFNSLYTSFIADPLTTSDYVTLLEQYQKVEHSKWVQLNTILVGDSARNPFETFFGVDEIVGLQTLFRMGPRVNEISLVELFCNQVRPFDPEIWVSGLRAGLTSQDIPHILTGRDREKFLSKCAFLVGLNQNKEQTPE